MHAWCMGVPEHSGEAVSAPMLDGLQHLGLSVIVVRVEKVSMGTILLANLLGGEWGWREGGGELG